MDGVKDAEHILEYAALHRGFMARLPGHILQRHSPRPLSAVAGWSLRPILFTPPGIRFPQRGVVIFGEVSCLTGVFTASHCPVQMSIAVLNLVNSGYDPETVITAVVSGDMSLLKHTGLISVQLLKPHSQLNAIDGGTQ